MCVIVCTSEYAKMAHQLAPSVNCSLDEIDLNALKVYYALRDGYFMQK